MLAIYDKYLIYMVCIIFRFGSKIVMRYQKKSSGMHLQDQIVIQVTLLLMSVVIGLVAFDVALFAPRSLLHANPNSIS